MNATTQRKGQSHGRILGIGALLLGLAAAPLLADQRIVDPAKMPGPLKEVSFEQHLDAQLPLDATFRDEKGREVKLGDYFGEKPVILTFVYYDCPMLCTLILNGMAKALAVLTFDPGREYEVVAISIDAKEGQEVKSGEGVAVDRVGGTPSHPPGRIRFADPEGLEHELRVDASGDDPLVADHPEVPAERVWEDIIKKLLLKEYKFDVGFYGSLNEFSRKVAYFFHASLQGTACYPGAADALAHVAAAGLAQGWLDNGQCFTPAQLQRGLAAQKEGAKLDDYFAADLRVLSHEHRARKPSEALFRHMLREAARGGQAMRGELFVEAQDVDDNSAAIVGDAVTVAVDGIVRMAQSQTGRERLTGLRQIEVVFGSSPGVARNGSRLVITVAPRLGPAGRPSSARVVRALS